MIEWSVISSLEQDMEGSFVDFLGAFAKLWKATNSYIMSARPSVRMAQLSSH